MPHARLTRFSAICRCDSQTVYMCFAELSVACDAPSATPLMSHTAQSLLVVALLVLIRDNDEHTY